MLRETSRTVTVRILGDTTFEPDEAFTLALTSSDAIVPASAPKCTIVNDDLARRRSTRH